MYFLGISALAEVPNRVTTLSRNPSISSSFKIKSSFLSSIILAMIVDTLVNSVPQPKQTGCFVYSYLYFLKEWDKLFNLKRNK